ncbi:MAG TPA: hypothetical protein VFE33_30320 [Thermoanaerobaculia bacterium]|nr:hypothetical protein [Thermoanaerobaculia bacterium]
MKAVLWLLLAQGLLGTFDTLYYHEWKAKLPARNPGTGLELKLHASRDFVYCLIFLTLPWIAWQGAWAVILSALILFEIVVTIVDFTTEDFVRKPLGGVFPGERATHTVMAIVYGAMLGNLVPVLLLWWKAPTGFLSLPVPVAPALRWLLTLLGLGVLVSGIRDLGSALGLPHWEWPWSVPKDRPGSP